MEGPNPELMHAYGTDQYYLEKAGALPPVARLVAPLASMALFAADSRHLARQQAEAEAMNQAFRMIQQQEMAQTVQGFKVASDRQAELQKVAEELGRELAHEMNKEALVGANLIGRGLLAAGKGLGRAGKSLGWGATGNIGRGGLSEAAGGAMRRLGIKTRQVGSSMTKAPAAAAPAATTAATAGGMQQAAQTSKPLISTGTKLKAGLGLGLLGTGYAGYKGLQTARDYMMQPTGMTRWGRYGPAPMHNVNQYGQASY